MKVFLDDIRQPEQIFGDGANEEWVVVKTIEEVMGLLKQGNITHLSLDNDLGMLYREGHELIPWMAENDCWPSEEVYVHTANPVWEARMLQDIDRLFYKAKKNQKQ